MIAFKKLPTFLGRNGDTKTRIYTNLKWNFYRRGIRKRGRMHIWRASIGPSTPANIVSTILCPQTLGKNSWTLDQILDPLLTPNRTSTQPGPRPPHNTYIFITDIMSIINSLWYSSLILHSLDTGERYMVQVDIGPKPCHRLGESVTMAQLNLC